MTNVYHSPWNDIQNPPFGSATSLLFRHLQSFFEALLGRSPTCPLVASFLLGGETFDACLQWLSLLPERHVVPVWLPLLTPFEVSPQISLLQPPALGKPPFLRVHGHSLIQQLLSPSAPPDLTGVKLNREDTLPSFTNQILSKAIASLLVMTFLLKQAYYIQPGSKGKPYQCQ